MPSGVTGHLEKYPETDFSGRDAPYMKKKLHQQRYSVGANKGTAGASTKQSSCLLDREVERYRDISKGQVGCGQCTDALWDRTDVISLDGSTKSGFACKCSQ